MDLRVRRWFLLYLYSWGIFVLTHATFPSTLSQVSGEGSLLLSDNNTTNIHNEYKQ
jgi:hypothetical protein